MNWLVFWLFIGIFAIACVIASLGVWLIDQGVHPAVFVGGLLLCAAILAGVLAP